MRAREILEKDYNQSLNTSVNDLLVAAKASGARKINTASLVSQLRAMGYAVDQDSIVELLGQTPVAVNANPTDVGLSDDSVDTGDSDPTADSAAKVSDMAAKATKIG